MRVMKVPSVVDQSRFDCCQANCYYDASPFSKLITTCSLEPEIPRTDARTFESEQVKTASPILNHTGAYRN